MTGACFLTPQPATDTQASPSSKRTCSGAGVQVAAVGGRGGGQRSPNNEALGAQDTGLLASLHGLYPPRYPHVLLFGRSDISKTVVGSRRDPAENPLKAFRGFLCKTQII